MKLRNTGLKLRLELKKLIIDVRHTHLKDLRNLTFYNLKKIPDVVHLKNLVLFSGLLSIVIVAMFVSRFNSLGVYFIKEVPAYGGLYSHGVVGTIEKINPLFVQDEAENVANKLVYSGLTRTVSATEYVPDLAESWTVSDDKLTYNFKLRQGVSWHDGEPFTASDVVYTIGLIQNPDTRTSLSQIWKGVKVERVNDHEVKFVLPNAFPEFLDVASQGILPNHLLGSIDSKNIKVAEFNTNPVGTGPYKFVRFDQISTQTGVVFESNQDFAIKRPYIEQIRLVLYDDSVSLVRGLARRQVAGVADVAIDKISEVKRLANLTITQNYLPQYEVLNFNYKNEILADKSVRLALAAAVNRTEIVREALAGNAREIPVPILPGRSGFDPKAKGVLYNAASANEALDKAGWVRSDNGPRKKNGKDLKLRLVYIDNAENNRVVSIMKKQFEAVGVQIELLPENVNMINTNYIRPRNYDMLMIGQNVGINADLYSFWHSSQIEDPGLNLTGFSDRQVDRLLEQVRKSSEVKYRSDRFRQIQEVLVAEQPALFLYSPIYTSAVGKDIHGTKQARISQSSDMLNNVYEWYIRTKKTR